MDFSLNEFKRYRGRLNKSRKRLANFDRAAEQVAERVTNSKPRKRPRPGVVQPKPNVKPAAEQEKTRPTTCDVCGRPIAATAEYSRHPKCANLLPEYEKAAKQRPLKHGRFHVATKAHGRVRFSVMKDGRVFIHEAGKYRKVHAGYARHYWMRMLEQRMKEQERKASQGPCWLRPPELRTKKQEGGGNK